MIDLKNIKKHYPLWKTGKFVEVLKGIDLHVDKGEFVAIMGPSGSGKSTLMNIIGMLDIPTSWTYILENIRVDNLKESKQSEIRRKHIGFIFQNYALIPRLNNIEQVKLPLIYQWISSKHAEKKALAALKKVRLEDKAYNMPNELSWWQKQRISIARSLVIEPSILLADEPTGALDSKTGEEIMNLFDELHEAGNTIIMITHEAEIAKRADRIIFIKDGVIS